jgi:hypothetical protein
MRRRGRALIVVIALAAVAVIGCSALLGLDAPVFDANGETGGGGDVVGPTGDDGSTTDAVTADVADVEDATACIPKTCAELDAACGSAPNACGGAIADCGACTPPDTCGAAGPNHCGDAGCVAKASCGVDQCGTVSNGCGGTLSCPACSGGRYCDLGAGACQPCTFFTSTCAPTGTSTCPGGLPPPPGNLYACSSAPSDPKCMRCPNPTTGQGMLYCCP